MKAEIKVYRTFGANIYTLTGRFNVKEIVKPNGDIYLINKAIKFMEIVRRKDNPSVIEEGVYVYQFMREGTNYSLLKLMGNSILKEDKKWKLKK